jgi:hypothetical protein
MFFNTNSLADPFHLTNIAFIFVLNLDESPDFLLSIDLKEIFSDICLSFNYDL